MRRLVTVDFETAGIQARPFYPPVPVGVAIRSAAGTSKYLAWGHPTNNNCVEAEAKAELQSLWENDQVDLLFHNGKFDLDVAEVHLGLAMPEWDRIHDSMFLLYLYDPHARTVALKPSAERILGEAPEERDKLKEWVVHNVACKPSEWGAHIADAPGDLVGEYAIGDVTRTFGLYTKCLSYVTNAKMLEAYDRERQLMPLLLASERHGIRVDTEPLEYALTHMEATMLRVDEELGELLGLGSNVADVVGSAKQLGDALEAKGHADPSRWLTTKKGNRSVSKDSLRAAVSNKRLLAMLVYRGQLKNALTTFLRPWVQLTVGQDYGRLHTNWHQVRNPDGYGTRTGRISSTKPNFANVPNEYEEPPEGYPALPLMRSFLLPDEGHVWIKRDYSSQELRVLAHFEDGTLMQAYIAEPNLDPHQFAADLIRSITGLELNRGDTKIIAFSIVYGKGVKNLAIDLGKEYHEGYAVKEGYLGSFPDVRTLSRSIKSIGDAGQPVRTVGGRLMYAEPPIGTRRFSYKLLNHLIQGSASDLTKQAIIDYYDSGGVGYLLAQVYDEVNLSVPISQLHRENSLLEGAMEGIELTLDLPLTSDMYLGDTWADADHHKNPDLTQLQIGSM